MSIASAAHLAYLHQPQPKILQKKNGKLSLSSSSFPPKAPQNGNSSDKSSILTKLFSSATAGTAAGFITFPFEGIKKRLQTGQPIVLNLPALFLGSRSFASSVGVAALASGGTNYIIQNTKRYNPSSKTHEACAAAAAGAIGAFFGSTPVENIILKQQLEKAGPVKAIQMLFKEGGPRRFLVGYNLLAFREAGFALLMLCGGRTAEQWTKEKTGSQILASGAELSVSLIGATVTQPFDTLASLKQKSDGKLSSLKIAQSILNEQGYKGFFAGLSGRCALFTGCVVLIPRIQEEIHSLIS